MTKLKVAFEIDGNEFGIDDISCTLSAISLGKDLMHTYQFSGGDCKISHLKIVEIK